MSTQYDAWLASDGPVALTITEPLEPASGAQSVFFPPTFAPPKQDEKANYVIDNNGVCLVDSVGAQANRLEPMFKQGDLAELVPQFTVKIGKRAVNLLDAGHRAADALVRFSDRASELNKAFLAYRDTGDARNLAEMAPTTLVFGAWDSRGTGAKIPRLVESTIRAYGVERLRRSAQYFAALESEELEQFGLKAEGKALSEHGLVDSPATDAPGGVIAKNGIRREALLNLVALRAIGSASSDATQTLQRYILGLALVAFLAPAQMYLRQGCLLVAKEQEPATMKIVWRSGKREELQVSSKEAIVYAKSCAQAFGVQGSFEATFDEKLVKTAIDKKADAKAAKAEAKAKKEKEGSEKNG
jgi:CRISPR-associated protein Csb1